MQSTTDMNITEVLTDTPIAIVVDQIVTQKFNFKTNDQISDLTKIHGPDSEIVKLLRAHKSAQDDELRDELKRIIDESARQQMPLQPMGKDTAAMLAAKHGITNREIGQWRRDRIITIAKDVPITEKEIEQAVFITGTPLNTMTATLLKDGKLVREGEGYRAVPQTANAD